MRIESVTPFILHVPVTGATIADSTHTVSHWGVFTLSPNLVRASFAPLFPTRDFLCHTQSSKQAANNTKSRKAT